MLCALCAEVVEVGPCAACGGDPILKGRYSLLSLRGQGGMGTTYRALDLDQDRIVAVKELPLRLGATAKQTQLFQREARVLKELSHPQIPAYVDDFEAGQGKQRALYLVQRFVDGIDLQEELQGRRYSVPEALELMADVLPVLIYLHGLSPPVLHRDLKPQNLIRDADTGRLFLVDFGSVRDAMRDHELGGSTVAGTFGFMAPEQFAGDASAATDLYGLGATAVALLCRKPMNSLLDHDRKLDWEPWVLLPGPVTELLTAMLAPDPAHRPASARALGVAVAGLLAEESWSENAPSAELVPVAAPAALEKVSAPPVTLGTRLVGAPLQIALDLVRPGRMPEDAHRRASALIEQALNSAPGRVTAAGETYRWATPVRASRMVRISVVDLGDGTTRIQAWERMSSHATGRYGAIMGAIGGGLGGGLAWAFLPFGPAAVGAWVGTMVTLSYLISRRVLKSTHDSRRVQLERAIEDLGRLIR